MKIAIVCGRSPQSYYGGVECHVKEVSKRLVKRGRTVKILAMSDGGHGLVEGEMNGVPIKVFPAIAFHETFCFSIPLYQALRKENSDILHCHGYQDFHIWATALSKHEEQKLVVTLHSGWPNSLVTRLLNAPYKFLLGKILKCADKIVCVSEFERDYFRCFLGASREKFVVIPNGTNFEDFHNIRNWPNIVPHNAKIILSIGRLERYKGHQYVIRSFSKMKHLRDSNLKLIIVGSGPYRSRLLKLVKNLKLEEHVLILSGLSREEVVGLYQRCEIFILLSRYESSGLSVIDAFAAGKPVIVSDVSYLHEYVKQGRAIGVPYPPCPKEVAKKMQIVLKETQNFVPRNVPVLSWDDVADRIDKLYADLLY